MISRLDFLAFGILIFLHFKCSMLVAVGLEHIYIIGRNIRETSMIYSGLVFKGSDREKERGYKLYTNASKNNR